MGDIDVEVDGLAVSVDRDAWERDPEAVSAQVRKAREELNLAEGDEDYKDYDATGGDAEDEGVEEVEDDLDEEADF